jgi:GTPase SAR1 family protein
MKWIKLFEDYRNKYKTIVIFGLPGSGKSYLSNEIKKDHPEMNYTIYDDYEWREGKAKFGKENQIVSDGILMMSPESSEKEIRRMGEDEGVDVEFLYFENDPVKSILNTKRRWESGETKDFQTPERMEKDIRSISGRYGVPIGITPLPIWTKK